MNPRWSGQMFPDMHYIGTIGDCDLYVDGLISGYAMVVHGDGVADWTISNTTENVTRHVRGEHRDAMRVALMLAGVKP